MFLIRIPQKHGGKVWRELVASGPISRVSDEPVYFVGEKQLQLLRTKKLPFDAVISANQKDSRHA